MIKMVGVTQNIDKKPMLGHPFPLRLLNRNSLTVVFVVVEWQIHDRARDSATTPRGFRLR